MMINSLLIILFVLSSPSFAGVVGDKTGVGNYSPSLSSTPISDQQSSGASSATDEVYILESQILNYPNPFKLSQGTELGFTLSKASDLTLTIFNRFGVKLASIDIPRGSEGGSAKYNKLKINASTFNNNLMPAGPYFYTLSSPTKTIGKGVFIIRPG